MKKHHTTVRIRHVSTEESQRQYDVFSRVAFHETI
jgi:hypothetical protein